MASRKTLPLRPQTLDELEAEWQSVTSALIERFTEKLALLQALYGVGQPVAPPVPAARRGRPRKSAEAKPEPKPKKRVTAEQKASRELQGRYLAFSRSLNKRQRAPLTKLNEEKGDRQKAINAMKREIAAAKSEPKKKAKAPRKALNKERARKVLKAVPAPTPIRTEPQAEAVQS